MKTEMHVCLYLSILVVVGQDILPFRENEEDCGLSEKLKFSMQSVIHETLARIMPSFISDIEDTGKFLMELGDKSKTVLTRLEKLEQTVKILKQIAGLPEFICTFEQEEYCFLENATNDDFDWTTGTDKTPSTNTGPYSASERLYYSYIEVSDPRKSGDTASLVSKEIISGGEKCLLFDYHMHGDGMGILKVFTFNATDEDEIYLKSGEQGCEWNTAIIPLTNANSYKLRIDGIRGSNFKGDIAIDNVKIVAKKCDTENTSFNESCPSGWVNYSSSCYKYFRCPLQDWASAKAYCKSLQSNLVEIENSSENEFLRRYLDPLITSRPQTNVIFVQITDIEERIHQFWIGNTDLLDEGVWTWATTGSRCEYTDWGTKEPNGGTNENCGTMKTEHGYQWNDEECSRKLYFICEKQI